MVRPEEVGRPRQSPCGRRDGTTFVKLGTGNGSRVELQYCAVSFWHDARNVGLQRQPPPWQQQQPHQLDSVPAMPQSSVSNDVPGTADGVSGRSDAAVRSLARRLDLQRLTDCGEEPPFPGDDPLTGGEVSGSTGD